MAKTNYNKAVRIRKEVKLAWENVRKQKDHENDQAPEQFAVQGDS